MVRLGLVVLHLTRNIGKRELRLDPLLNYKNQCRVPVTSHYERVRHANPATATHEQPGREVREPDRRGQRGAQGRAARLGVPATTAGNQGRYRKAPHSRDEGLRQRRENRRPARTGGTPRCRGGGSTAGARGA